MPTENISGSPCTDTGCCQPHRGFHRTFTVWVDPKSSTGDPYPTLDGMLHLTSYGRLDVESYRWHFNLCRKSSSSPPSGCRIPILVYTERHVLSSLGKVTCSIPDSANAPGIQDFSSSVTHLYDDYAWQTEEYIGSNTTYEDMSRWSSRELVCQQYLSCPFCLVARDP